MHIIKILLVNYGTLRQYLNFNCTDFLIFVLVLHHVTFQLRVFFIRQTNFASYEELTSSRVFDIIYFDYNLCNKMQLCGWVSYLDF